MALENKKIVMVVAHTGFRDEEYTETKKVLEKAGAKIVVASNHPGKAIGKFGSQILVDLVIHNIKEAEFEAIVIIGGPGVTVLFSNNDLFRTLIDFKDRRKVIAAICSAPVVLANAGLLAGKKATAFSEDKEKLELGGAFYTGRLVERDGDIITANGPRVAAEFGEAIIKAIEWQMGHRQIRSPGMQPRKRF